MKLSENDLNSFGPIFSSFSLSYSDFSYFPHFPSIQSPSPTVNLIPSFPFLPIPVHHDLIRMHPLLPTITSPRSDSPPFRLQFRPPPSPFRPRITNVFFELPVFHDRVALFLPAFFLAFFHGAKVCNLVGSAEMWEHGVVGLVHVVDGRN